MTCCSFARAILTTVALLVTMPITAHADYAWNVTKPVEDSEVTTPIPIEGTVTYGPNDETPNRIRIEIYLLDENGQQTGPNQCTAQTVETETNFVTRTVTIKHPPSEAHVGALITGKAVMKLIPLKSDDTAIPGATKEVNITIKPAAPDPYHDQASGARSMIGREIGWGWLGPHGVT